MDLCNAARLPDDLNKNGQLENEIRYEGKRCVILNDADINEFTDAITSKMSTQILVVHGYKSREIPGQIEGLDNLQMLLIGTSSLSNLSSTVSKLINLSVLDLSGNQIEEIPDCWGTLENLKIVDFSKNVLRKLPHSFYSLKQLQSLDLSENRFSELPSDLGEMKRLQVLSCSFNSLSSLPEEITCLINLLVLRLMNNKLCYLPRSFGGLKSLLVLQLDFNNFDHFPHQIFGCQSLVEFSIAGNSIVGYLPQEFESFLHLRNLSLAKNSCSGINQVVSKLRQLEYLDFSGNKSKETQFSCVGLQNLQELYLSGCGLTSLSEDIGLLQHLVILDLSSNKLSSFPPTITGFPKLTALLLGHNRLSRLPDWTCMLDNLVVLELQSNNLTDLPQEFTRLAGTVRQIDLSFNQFRNLPISICHPQSRLTFLCFDSNPLQALPEEVSLLKDLTHLTLANCSSLTSLPTGIGACTSLRMLRLCHCALESLPSSFAKLHSLKYLDLSHTNFAAFPAVICYLPRLKVLLYDQREGKPLVTQEDPTGWFARSRLLYPETDKFARTDAQTAKTHWSMYPTLEEALSAEIGAESGLPTLIGRLSQLTHLSLQANGLFMLPDVFHTMNLRRLNLSHNRLYFLPNRFHKSRSLTHLYLHNNRIERLNENFQQLRALRVLTLAGNPLICPPSEICSERKVPPVFHYLRRKKAYDDALLAAMCQTVLDMLPKEAVHPFLSQLGYPQSAIEILEQEFPGGYNYTKRIRAALEAWSGLTFDESLTSSVDQSLSSRTGPEQSHEPDSVIQGPIDDSEKHSSQDQTSAITSGTGANDSGHDSSVVPLDESRLSQIDLKSAPTRQSQSVHSLALGPTASSVHTSPSVIFLLKEATAGLEVSPNRLMHLIHLLGLGELHEKLCQLVNNAELPRF